MTPAFLARIRALRGYKSGIITPARRAATRYTIDCLDLNEDNPAQLVGLQDRRDWCEERCPTDYEIEPLREDGPLTGRRFRFVHQRDAALFKLFFC
jgi:hypothetical protein